MHLHTLCSHVMVNYTDKTVAFPPISIGAYGFPMDRASRIVVRETKDFLKRNRSVEKVFLVCFGATALEIHQAELKEV
jgi:O-acetyl-ADP-ribose deacetylase (regulator of RNase III)